MKTPGGFDEAAYANIRKGCQDSADVIVPMMLDRLTHRPGRVIDVGCGEGWFARRFADEGIEVVGLDVSRPPEWPYEFVECDLARVVPYVAPGDLVVCLEVAEHLPPQRATGFVAELCRLAPVVLWSAAIPGQGGHMHVNEQWPTFWAPLFATAGYSPNAWPRDLIWNDVRVEPWYRQNLVLYVEGAGPPPPVFDVVHPEIFAWYRS